MVNIDDLFGPPDLVQDVADEQLGEDRAMLAKLVTWRKSQRLTQAEVGDRLGVTQAAIQQFERAGGDPHLSTIRRYALAVDALVRHTVVLGAVDFVRDAKLPDGIRHRTAQPAGRDEWRAAVDAVGRSSVPSVPSSY